MVDSSTQPSAARKWGIWLSAYGVLASAAVLWLPDVWVQQSLENSVVTDALGQAEAAAATTAARQSVLLAAGGILAVITLFLTQQRDALARARHEIDRQKHEIDRQKLDIDRDANRTTRYTEAIKQLGDEAHLAIRLGGIYALERIAIDSERDRQTILDVLTTWIKDQARRKLDVSGPRADRPRDVAAAIVVVGRVSDLGRRGEAIDLAHADLSDGRLRRADLSGAILADVDLSSADLTEATLADAHLPSANLHEARLNRADFTRAMCHGVDFSNAFLVDTNFSEARFRRTIFTGAVFDRTIFCGTDLRTVRDLPNDVFVRCFWDEATQWPDGTTPPYLKRLPVAA